MHKDNIGPKVMTHSRPQVEKRTVGAPGARHILEDILRKPSVRKALLWMTKRDLDGKCFFIRLCENYDNPQADFRTRLKWRFPNWAINFGLRSTGLDKETMKRQLFHHPPTVKALTLTAKSVGTYGLTAPQRFTAPLFAVWNVTQACNLSCKHCYQNALHKPAADEMTTREKLDLIDQMGKEYVPFLALAGGEPLVARDLWPVLERCTQQGIHVTLATNGTLLTPPMCERLKAANVKYVEVSLDSLDPATHDEFRGMKGAWARSVQGIRNSVAAGIRTGMACCFTRQTADSADEMIKFAIDLGCHTFSHFNFIPVGRGREIMDSDMPPGQRELLLQKLQRHLEESPITVVSTAPQFGRACIMYGSQDGLFATGHAGRGRGRKTMVLSRYIGGCGTGRCYCAIQPNGFVTPCVYISGLKVGDLRRRTLAEIWSNPLFEILSDREDRGDHCGVCDYRQYCGGCRARAYAYTGDIQAGDPGCIYNYHEWQELSEAAGDVEDGQLVQLVAATGAVRSAAESGEATGMSTAEMREMDSLAEQVGSLIRDRD